MTHGWTSFLFTIRSRSMNAYNRTHRAVKMAGLVRLDAGGGNSRGRALTSRGVPHVAAPMPKIP